MADQKAVVAAPAKHTPVFAAESTALGGDVVEFTFVRIIAA